jgi:hypothetical protein
MPGEARTDARFQLGAAATGDTGLVLLRGWF